MQPLRVPICYFGKETSKQREAETQAHQASSMGVVLGPELGFRVEGPGFEQHLNY